MNSTNRQDDGIPGHPSDANALFDRLPDAERARLRAIWDLAEGTDLVPDPDSAQTDQALQTLLVRIGASNGSPSFGAVRRHDREPRRRTRGVFRGRNLAMGLAAALAVLAWCVFLWTRPVVRVTDAGEQLVFTLPDGSRVEMNSGSRLSYNRGFGGARAVDLIGEAFFSVVESTDHFEVRTHNATVRVLGTRFGVRAWRDSDGTTVAVESGRVALSARMRNEPEVELSDGQTGRVRDAADGPRPVERVDVSVGDATAWRRGDLVYKDQHLGVVVEDVRRRFAAVIVVRPQRLRETRISLALRQPENAEVVVRDVASALGLSYRPIAGGFELHPRVSGQQNEAGAN